MFVGSFGGSIGHLARCRNILPTSSSRFDLPYVVQIVALAFLGCWALNVPALVTHFYYDDHLIFLNVITYVETNISSFQMA